MKTITCLLSAAALGSAIGLGAAAMAASPASAALAPPASPSCRYMLVPHPAMPAAKAMRVTVACTPETLRNDAVCQRACVRKS